MSARPSVQIAGLCAPLPVRSPVVVRSMVLLLALTLAAAGVIGCDDGTSAARAVDEGPSGGCDPSYPDDCLDSDAYDYDCEGGEGDGPKYVAGPVAVTGDDPFDLDRDGDGTGCDSYY
jgi:hypothetical protein